MTVNVKVVYEAYALEEAYRMGYRRFDGGDPIDEDDAPVALDNFRQSATYANHTLPNLRAMAGHSDSGYGTYTETGKVALVEPGCEEDEPADARLVDAREFFHRLTDAWQHGAMDGATGDSYDPDAAQTY